jgi:hypothetical protein
MRYSKWNVINDSEGPAADIFRIEDQVTVKKKTRMYRKRENMGRLCGLVARVLGYRSGGPGSIPGTTKKK